MAKGKFLKKKKLTAGKVIGRVVLVILLVLLLLIGAVFAFVWSKLNLITYDPGSSYETIADTQPTDQTDASEPLPSETIEDPTETIPEETFDTTGLAMAEAPSYSEGELFKDKDVMNILLVGTDEFSGGFSKASRGDVNILVSINKAEKTVKLVSFSRGIAIKMLDGPYKGQYEWLTNAHRWAGHAAVLEALSDAFKIEINRYVRVNFNSVTKIVDAIGGIEMELTAKEANFINKQHVASTPTQKKLVEGWNHLDGGTATYYARLRGIDDDWYRVVRQRKAILAVVDKLKGSSFSTLNDLCDMALSLVQTNLTRPEIAELILYSPTFLESEFDQMTIPIANSYGGMTVMSGAAGWALDYDKNNAALHEFLFGVDAE